MSKDYNICILGGGWSNEREISLKSSEDVYKALSENKHSVFLYDMKSPSASNSRGFARGSIFKEDGTMIASVAQEGLMRKLKK